VHRAHLAAHVLIHHQQPEAVLEPLQPVAAGEAFEVAVGVAEEHVEGELLGEVAELLAVGRADELAQLGPHAGLAGLGVDVGAQARRAGKLVVVPGQGEAHGGEGFGEAGGFGVELGEGEADGLCAVVGRRFRGRAAQWASRARPASWRTASARAMAWSRACRASASALIQAGSKASRASRPAGSRARRPARRH
jgi:hypothetical protein